MGPHRKLLATVKKRKLKFFGHVTRVQYLCTQMLEYRIDRKQSRGKQRRWANDIKNRTKETIATYTTIARWHRESWRTLVHKSTIPDPQSSGMDQRYI